MLRVDRRTSHDSNLCAALRAAFGSDHCPALTEGPERALVAELAAADERGRAFGLYHAVTGGMALFASLVTGALWQRFGAATALGTGAALAGAAALGLWTLVPERTPPPSVVNAI